MSARRRFRKQRALIGRGYGKTHETARITPIVMLFGLKSPGIRGSFLFTRPLSDDGPETPNLLKK